MELIDKSALVAEIERIEYETNYEPFTDEVLGKRKVCKDIKDFLNTLEVKEVDLDESARHYLLHEHTSPLNDVFHQLDIKAEMQYHKDIEDAYKAGFELGLKAKKGE